MEVFVGSSKDSLMLKANPELIMTVNTVVLEFGKFMKIIVHFSENVRIVTDQRLNAFEILKQAQLQLSGKKLHHVLRKGIKKISYTIELSKHCKRSASNMAAAVIESLSAKLFRLLQANYFSRDLFFKVLFFNIHFCTSIHL